MDEIVYSCVDMIRVALGFALARRLLLGYVLPFGRVPNETEISHDIVRVM